MNVNTFPALAEATHSKYPQWFEYAEALATTPYEDSAVDAKDIIIALVETGPMELYIIAKIAAESGNLSLLQLIPQIAEEKQYEAIIEAELLAGTAQKFQETQRAMHFSAVAVEATQLLFNASPKNVAAIDPQR